MDASEQAAEQIVRMTLSGSEVALRLTGSLSKNVAAGLLSMASNTEKTKGKTRLASMLKGGKELKVFQLDALSLERFAREAKRYGVLYVVVRPKCEGRKAPVDIMVKAEDASKINRIFDKLEVGRVDRKEVGSAVAETEAAHETAEPGSEKPDSGRKEKNAQAMEEILGVSQNEKAERESSPLEQAPREILSEATSERRSRFAGAISEKAPDKRERRSVKRDIEMARKKRQGLGEKPKEHREPTRKDAIQSTARAQERKISKKER